MPMFSAGVLISNICTFKLICFLSKIIYYFDLISITYYISDQCILPRIIPCYPTNWRDLMCAMVNSFFLPQGKIISWDLEWHGGAKDLRNPLPQRVPTRAAGPCNFGETPTTSYLPLTLPSGNDSSYGIDHLIFNATNPLDMVMWKIAMWVITRG